MKLADMKPGGLLDDVVLVEGPSEDAASTSVRQLLESLGQDTARQGLARTPERVARMYHELLAGYDMDAAALVNGARFPTDYEGIVLVRNIEFRSLCEHHLLPFFGHVHVAYIPDREVIGLSKIPRIVDMFARRLQMQEQMTQQIAESIADLLKPKGVAVGVEAAHMCAIMRGVQKSDARMVTWTYLGDFKSNPSLRNDLAIQMGQPAGAAPLF
jgi:GTP cyclohydrolase I